MGPKLKNQIKKSQKQQKENQLKKKDSYLADDHNFQKFTNQLAKIGLELRDIGGDGNCLFRALSDQLDGTESNHLVYRKHICEYMMRNRDEFEPFVVALAEEIDDKNKKKSNDLDSKKMDLFEKYVHNLEQPGVYGGNDCLAATARLYKLEINVHQLDQPIWKVSGFTGAANGQLKQIHLSYHNGEHYSSVRQIGDATHKPTNIQIYHAKKAGTVPAVVKSAKKDENPNTYAAYDDYEEAEIINHDIPADIVDHIIGVTNFCDLTSIKEVYVENNGNLDDTVTAIMSMLAIDDAADKNNVSDEKKPGCVKNKKINAKEKKFLKKQRQMERQRNKVLEEREAAPKTKQASNDEAHNCKLDDEFKIALSNVEATNI